MSQPGNLSAFEAAANLVLGSGLAAGLQLAVFPVMGLAVAPAQSLQTGGAFMAVSAARSNALRRLFERIRHGGGGHVRDRTSTGCKTGASCGGPPGGGGSIPVGLGGRTGGGTRLPHPRNSERGIPGGAERQIARVCGELGAGACRCAAIPVDKVGGGLMAVHASSSYGERA